MDEGIEGLDFHGGRAADVELDALRSLDVFEFVDDARVVCAVLDARGEYRRAVHGGRGRRHGLREALEAADLHVDVHELLVALRASDDELDRLCAEARELLVETILRDAGLLRGRQVGFVDAAEGHGERGQRECEQEAGDADGDPGGALHRELGQLVPPGVFELSCFSACAAHGPLVDVCTEEPEERGEYRDREERGEAHGGNRAVGDGLEEGLREDEEPGERESDHEGGEDHGLAGGRGGAGDGVLGLAAGVELLAEAGDHEQAVVDGQAQAQQRDDGLGKRIDLEEAREHREDAQ